MKLFLNRYMATNRRLEKQSAQELEEIFKETTKTIFAALGKKAFRPKRAVNAAVVDSLMTGIAKRIQAKGPIKNLKEFRIRFYKLLKDTKYVAATETGTAQEANVRTRLAKAERAFKHLV